MPAAEFDYDRIARESALALRAADLMRDIVAHAVSLAEHTADRFEPVGSVYYLDQFLTVAGEDLRRRTPSGAFGALIVPGWVGRFAVLSKPQRVPVLQSPGLRPEEYGGTALAVGVCRFGALPNLINPMYDYTAVYPFRAPRDDEW